MPGRPSLWPREHGAYAEVGFPLTTALLVGDPSWAGALAASAVIFAFLTHEPLLVVGGRRGARAARLAGRRATLWATTSGGLALVCGLAAAWQSMPVARWALAGVVLVGGLIGWLAVLDHEKTLVGESLVAVGASVAAVPVALSGGLDLVASLAIAAVWAAAFVLATWMVHALLHYHRDGAVAPLGAVGAVAGVTVTAAIAAAVLAQHWWALAVLPVTLVTVVVLARRVPLQRLRAVGWSLVVADVATLGLLVVTVPR